MNVSELMKRPYHVILVRDEAADGPVGWVASVAELPGCLSQGDTPGEAGDSVQEAMELWFEAALEQGAPIPEPTDYVFPRMLLREEAARMSEQELKAHADEPLVSMAAGAWANLIRAWIAEKHLGIARR